MPRKPAITVDAQERNEFARAAMQALIPILIGVVKPRDIPKEYAGDKAAWLADEAFVIADAMVRRSKEFRK